MKRAICSAAALALGAALLLTGCAREGVDYVDATEDIADSFPFEAEPAGANPQQAEESNTYAVFHTTAGDITVMLYPKESPEEVARFMEQAKAGAYDGQQFVYVRRGGLIESDNAAEGGDETAGSTSESTSVPGAASSLSAGQSVPAEEASSSAGASASDMEGAGKSASAAEAAGRESAPGAGASESAALPKSEAGSAQGGAGASAASQSGSGMQAGASSESSPDAGYTEEELDAVTLPELPQDVQGAYYSDNLHHYYGAVGVSRQNENGGDRLHFVVEQTKPEDERLVPVSLYMRRLINQRMAQLNVMTQQQPFTDIQLAAFEARLNEEIQALADGTVPDEYAALYEPVNDMYSQVGGQWALDYQYPVIGQIVEGQNVADAISQAKVDAQTRKPKQDIVIEHVEIVEP